MLIPKIITRLIIRECIIRTLIVLLAVLSMFIVFDALDTAKGAFIQQNGIAALLLLRIFFDLPSRIYELMPLAVLIGTIWALSLLARSSELTIILTSGYTVNRLILLLSTFGLIMGVLGMGTDEILDTWSQSAKKRTPLIHKTNDTGLKSNIWLRYRHQLIHADQLKDHTITGLIIVEIDQDFSHIKSMIKAKSAFYDDTHWTLEDGVQYIFPHASNPIFLGPKNTVRPNTLPDFEWLDPFNPPLDQPTQNRTIRFSKKVWQDSPAPRYFIRQDKHRNRLKLRDLVSIYYFNRENALRSEALEVAMWKKLLYPLIFATMAIIGIPFCLRSARQMQTNVRLFIGIMIGIAFFVIQSIFANLGIISVPPIIGVLLPLVAFASLTLLGIWWMQRH